MYDMQGEFDDLPGDKLTDRFVWRSTTDETLQYGDRIIIRIRGDFIVDECCRAVDGNHLGGAVPSLEELSVEPIEEPPGPPCPSRRSGNGTEGGEFISWVFVQDRHSYDQSKGEAS
jgi:hypothetical protein